MTIEEALATPGRIVEVWDNEVIDGKVMQIIYRLAEDGAKSLASRGVEATDRTIRSKSGTSIEIAHSDNYCDFVWVSSPNRVEVYDSHSKVLDAAGAHAKLADGNFVSRTDIAVVFAFATSNYVCRGVKAVLKSGQEITLLIEASASAMGDPTYSRNELLVETGWAPTIAAAIAKWAGASCENRI
jgi:hypothetical protein